MMSNLSEAVILCGGKGKRLRSVTLNEIPKVLVPIQNKSILTWELDWLLREGIDHVILAVGHLGDNIKKQFGSEYSSDFGSMSIDYSFEKEKLGSGGAFKQASQQIGSKKCLVFNGDVITNSSLLDMLALHNSTNALATMYLVRMRSPYGVVETSDSFITKFQEKPLLNHYIHGGIDIIESTLFERFPDKGQMEDTIFVDIANEGKFAGYKAKENEYWQSIDSEKDFDVANNNWMGL